MAANAIQAIIAHTKAQEADGFSVAAASCSVAISRVSRQLFDAGAVLKSPQTKVSEFAKLAADIDDPSLIVLVQAEDQPQGFLVLDPLLVNALIELSTGAGERQVYKERRAPTLIDAALTRAFCESLLSSLPNEQAELYDNATLPRLRYHAFETDPARLPFVLPDGDFGMVSGDLEFQSGARGGPIKLALPLRLWSGEGPRKADPNSLWARHLEAALLAAPLRLRAVLERLEMPLAEAGALAVGDVLPIAASSISNLFLEDVEGHAVLRGRLGQIAGRKAIAITGSPVKGLLKSATNIAATKDAAATLSPTNLALGDLPDPSGNMLGAADAAQPLPVGLPPLVGTGGSDASPPGPEIAQQTNANDF